MRLAHSHANAHARVRTWMCTPESKHPGFCQAPEKGRCLPTRSPQLDPPAESATASRVNRVTTLWVCELRSGRAHEHRRTASPPQSRVLPRRRRLPPIVLLVKSASLPISASVPDEERIQGPHDEKPERFICRRERFPLLSSGPVYRRCSCLLAELRRGPAALGGHLLYLASR